MRTASDHKTALGMSCCENSRIRATRAKSYTLKFSLSRRRASEAIVSKTMDGLPELETMVNFFPHRDSLAADRSSSHVWVQTFHHRKSLSTATSVGSIRHSIRSNACPAAPMPVGSNSPRAPRRVGRLRECGGGACPCSWTRREGVDSATCRLVNRQRANACPLTLCFSYFRSTITSAKVCLPAVM